MKNTEFFEAVRYLAKEKKISEDLLFEGIQRAIVTAVKRDYNNKDIVFCEIDSEEDLFRVFVRKNVVTEILDPDEDMTVDQARRFKKTAVAGDIIEIELETKEVSRIAAEKGKHILRQAIREAEHGQIKAEFENKKQEIVTAKVTKIDPETLDAFVEIGKISERLLRSEQLPTDNFNVGDIVKVYIAEIREATRGPKATISRTHPGLVRRLLESEVPEIYDGTVEIMSVSREAGSRSKIAVHSADENVDPVGACIGQRGVRINKIVDILGGIDIELKSDMQIKLDGEAPIELKSGKNHINGDVARNFVRYREGYISADLGRIDAQKLFLNSLFAKISSGMSLPALFSLAKSFEKNSYTNVKLTEFVPLIFKACFSSKEPVTMFVTMPGEADTTNTGLSYYFLNKRSAEIVAQKYMFAQNNFDPEKIFVNTSQKSFVNIYNDENLVYNEYSGESVYEISLDKR